MADVSGSAPRRRGPPTNPLDSESIEEASRRAAAAPIAFNPRERIQYVRSMVARVIEYLQERKSAEDIKTLLPEFAEEYKHLFEMITSLEGYDANNLNMMLAMLDRMGQGSLSQHEASVIVGKRLFDKYGKK